MMRRIPRETVGLAVAALLLILALRARAADDPEIAVESSANEIYIGESIDYTVEIRNVKNPVAPDLSALRRDFDIVSNGDESHNQSSTFIFNGRVTQQTSFGHSYRYPLKPKRTGKLVIPAPSVTIDGKTISGRALALNVIAPEAQDLVVPEIKTDRQKIYPTQPFEVTLRVLVRPLPDGSDRDPVAPLRRSPPHLEINWVDLPPGLTGDDKARWLEKLLADDGAASPSMSSPLAVVPFLKDRGWRSSISTRDAKAARALMAGPINYFVYELKRKLTAEKAGTYAMGPALVKGSFVDGKEGTSYTARRLVAVAPMVPVEVREVPTPRPATFCGGIGSYRLAASASPTSLRVGDPLTLTLNIERGPSSGSLDLISAPDLAASHELAANFEILDKSPTGRKEHNSKRFEYGLRPKRAGVGIPALAVTVFDPDTEKFSEITTEPIALDVSAGSRVAAADLVGSVAGSATPEIKSREQGIFQNITDPSELHDERVNVPALAGIAVGAWFTVACLIAGVSAHRRKSGDLVWQRRRHARRAAQRMLAKAREALAAGRSVDALRAIRSAVIGLIADMCNLVGEGLTASEAESILTRTAVSAADRAEIFRLLEAIESAEYGSGAASEAPAMLESVEAIIPRLTRGLERGG